MTIITPSPLRDDDQPFSSFGLILAHYGREYVADLDVSTDKFEAIHRAFDTKNRAAN
ncbi:MAG: hypothetical protein P8M25_18680 [Paracoccaceae bacterium]|nr:hypothetical protein [Paracoccaceae bacterium]